MTPLRSKFHIRPIAAMAAMAFAAPSFVVPSPAQAADCYSIGQQIAAEQGGTLAKASASSQGGQSVCVIVVLVPGKDGQRPRRVEVVVPGG